MPPTFFKSREKRERKEKKDLKKGFKKFRKKVCKFCIERMPEVDYKDVPKLQRCITEKGKILSRRISGNCARHQRMVTDAIKRAREIALLPYTVS